MGDNTAIQWSDATWNPLVGCSRVSEGCRNCYAERLVHRGLSPRHRGLTRLVNGTPHWTGEVRLLEEALDLPLRWTRPRRIFVNSLSDLFHEQVPDAWIDRVFGVMAQAERHTFQVLTKRPERMRAYLSDRTNAQYNDVYRSPDDFIRRGVSLPLPNVWLGVSVEDQPTADARIPLLLQTPAAVRWVSYEPALGPADFARWLSFGGKGFGLHDEWNAGPLLDWLVVGGESGPGARPFGLAWARSVIAQCKAAGVPVFVKQLGARPVTYWCAGGADCTHPDCGNKFAPLRDRKGGDPEEWPADLRVREWPR